MRKSFAAFTTYFLCGFVVDVRLRIVSGRSSGRTWVPLVHQNLLVDAAHVQLEICVACELLTTVAAREYMILWMHGSCMCLQINFPTVAFIALVALEFVFLLVNGLDVPHQQTFLSVFLVTLSAWERLNLCVHGFHVHIQVAPQRIALVALVALELLLLPMSRVDVPLQLTFIRKFLVAFFARNHFDLSVCGVHVHLQIRLECELLVALVALKLIGLPVHGVDVLLQLIFTKERIVTFFTFLFRGSTTIDMHLQLGIHRNSERTWFLLWLQADVLWLIIAPELRLTFDVIAPIAFFRIIIVGPTQTTKVLRFDDFCQFAYL